MPTPYNTNKGQSETDSNQYTPIIRNTDEIQLFEKGINQRSDLDIINYYHAHKGDGQIYLVDDKANDRLSVYRDGTLIKSYDAIHGKNKDSDAMTVTYKNSDGSIKNLAGNLTTPAGIYFTTKGVGYNGAPNFIRRTREMVQSNNPKGIPGSIHVRTLVEGANTNGCTGMSAKDLEDLAQYINEPNVPTYHLPVNKKNRFFIRNGELQFKSSDIQETPAYNTRVTIPIEKITYNAENLTETNRNIINSFARSLIRNKKSLQEDLGINNDTYDNLVKGTLGILGVESGYGNENSAVGNFLRLVRKALFKNNSSPDYKSKFYTYNINGDNNSVGLTQIRFSHLSEREQELFDKYGITKESLVDDPEKAAIATMIKLAQNYLDRGQTIDKAISGWNNKPTYLKQVQDQMRRFDVYEKYQNGGSLPIGNQNQYDNVTSIYQALIDRGVDEQSALEIVNQKVAERGYSDFSTGDRKVYKDAESFADHIVDWMGRMYPGSLDAQNFDEYWKSIQITPKYKYNSEDPDYENLLKSTRLGVKKRINFYRQQKGLKPLTWIPNNFNNIV